MEIDILIEAHSWDDTGLDALAEVAFATTLRELGKEPALFAVSILACDDARIAMLNADFRGKAQATNVLSWPAEEVETAPGDMPRLPMPEAGDPPHELGDIALAHETIAREAADAGRTFAQHLSHLLVHGLLHLLGFDHISDPDAELMEGLETRILARLGIPDPY